MRTEARIEVPRSTVEAPERHHRRRGRVVPYLGATVGVLALEGLVLLPRGDPSLAVRAARLTATVVVSAALALAWSRAGRVGRGIVELVVGAVGLIAGGVATVPRIGELPAAHGILGVAAAASGLALLVIGTVHVLGAVRSRWRRLLAIPVGLLVVVYLLVPVAFGVLLTNRARPTLGERTPADLGLAFEEVTVAAPDELRLRAWYVPSGNGAAVLALPGSGSTRDDLLDHAALLARHGYGVLMLDVPGHGGSSGEPMEWGWGVEAYLPAALDALVAREDVTGRIGLLGLSMGGEQALTFAAYDDRVSAVVSEGATTRTAADGLRMPDAPLAKVLGYPISWVSTVTADLLADASPPIALEDAVRASAPTPLLLIAGAPAKELEANGVYAAAAGDRAELWHVAGSPHVGGLSTAPAEYEARVIAFLDAALLAS